MFNHGVLGSWIPPDTVRVLRIESAFASEDWGFYSSKSRSVLGRAQSRQRDDMRPRYEANFDVNLETLIATPRVSACQGLGSTRQTSWASEAYFPCSTRSLSEFWVEGAGFGVEPVFEVDSFGQKLRLCKFCKLRGAGARHEVQSQSQTQIAKPCSPKPPTLESFRPSFPNKAYTQVSRSRLFGDLELLGNFVDNHDEYGRLHHYCRRPAFIVLSLGRRPPARPLNKKPKTLLKHPK